MYYLLNNDKIYMIIMKILNNLMIYLAIYFIIYLFSQSVREHVSAE